MDSQSSSSKFLKFETNTSSLKSPLDLDKKRFTREELLEAFPTILELDSNRPETDDAVRCLTCEKTIIARTPHAIVKHLKGPEHIKKQKSLEGGISKSLYAVLSKYPPDAFRLVDNVGTIQCAVCRTNLSSPKLGEAVKVHLDSEFHIRSVAIKSQRDVLDCMNRFQYDRLFVQTFLVDGEMSLVTFEKIRKPIEAMLGRPLPGESFFRKTINELKAAKDDEGKDEWKNITIPEPDPMVVQILEEKKKKKKECVKKRKSEDKVKEKRPKKLKVQNKKNEVKTLTSTKSISD